MAAFTLTVSGNRNNAAVRDINVRGGPGTGFDALFTIRVGTANLTVLEVQPDAKKIGQNNKTFQWLKTTFPNGKEGWIRDDLVDVVGDGTAFGYGVVAQPTNGFTLTRTVAPPGQGTATTTTSSTAPAGTAAPSDAMIRMRNAAFNITSAFEGGGYASYQNTDSGIISYGRFQFTMHSGNLTTIVTRYTQRSTNPVAAKLKAFLPRIKAKDEGLRKDPELKAQLVEAASDPIMQAVQDEVAGDTFWQAVIDLSIKPRNIQSALGHALLFDMSIHHGLFNFLVPKAEEVLGLKPKSVLGQNGSTEPIFITKLAELRRDNLNALAVKLNAGGLKVRGDFWVALVASGDWNLQGDADGNLNVKGKIRQVRNP